MCVIAFVVASLVQIGAEQVAVGISHGDAVFNGFFVSFRIGHLEVVVEEGVEDPFVVEVDTAHAYGFHVIFGCGLAVADSVVCLGEDFVVSRVDLQDIFTLVTVEPFLDVVDNGLRIGGIAVEACEGGSIDVVLAEHAAFVDSL